MTDLALENKSEVWQYCFQFFAVNMYFCRCLHFVILYVEQLWFGYHLMLMYIHIMQHEALLGKLEVDGTVKVYSILEMS